MTETRKGCPAIERWDPYDASFRADPFPTYAKFRRECPVGRSEEHGGFWAVSRYADIFDMTRDAETFSSADGVTIPPFPFKGRALPMESDPPEHDAFRKILTKEFTPNAVRAREPMMRKMATELIDEFLPAGRADFSEDYAKLLPTAVICQLLDIDYLGSEFQNWAEQIIYDRKNPELGKQAAESIFDFFKDLIPRRRENLGDDFISALLRAEVGGKPLDDATVLDFCWFLLIAGLDNTAFTIRNLLLQIDNNDWLRKTLLAEPGKIPAAVEETLRLYSPVWGLGRTATKDRAFKGQKIAKGDKLLLLFASADRDEAEFPDPDKFVLGRAPNRHMAFGMGRHRCLGSHLARLEIRVAVEEILQRIPDYQVTEAVGWNEMGPLPVSFAAGGG